MLPAGIEADKLTWIYGNSNPTFSAPVEKGQVLSNVQVWYGSKCLAQTDLVAMNDVPVKQAEQETDDPVVNKDDEKKSGGIPQWVVIVACILVGIVVLVMALRVFSKFLRQAKQNARRRRRRNDRQRSR